MEFASDSDDDSAEIGLEKDSREPRNASARNIVILYFIYEQL